MKKTKMFSVLLTVALILSCVPVYAANGGAAAGVTEEMTAASFWSDRALIKKDPLLMTAEEIDAMNQLIIDTSGTYVYDMESFSEPFDAAKFRKSLAANEVPTRDLYIDGKLIDNAVYYGELNKKIASTGYGTNQEYNRYAICVALADLKSLPTSDKICYSLTDTADEIQTSSLLVGEPFVIRQKCENGGKLFYWGYSCNCTGWVDAEKLAICADKEEWTAAWKFSAADPDVLVVTGDTFALEESLFSPNSSKLELKQGTILKLAAAEDIPETTARRSTWYNHIVVLPVRNADGSYSTELAEVAVNNDVSVGFVPMTQSNLMKLAFNSLGDRYGWGNMLGATDCSGYIRNIYRCFGLNIPRNTTWQQLVPGTLVDLSYMTDDEKLQCIRSLPLGSCLYFPGHAMVYTGMSDGVPYAISNTGSLSDSVGELRVRDIYSVILNPLTVRRANGSLWLSNLTAAVVFAPQYRAKVFIPEHYLLADVKKSDYFYDAVEWALKNKITAGVDKDHFAPARVITAGELMSFLRRAFELQTEPDLIPSAKLSRGMAIDIIQKCTGKELSYDESVSLDDMCTRAMAIEFLYRIR